MPFNLGMQSSPVTSRAPQATAPPYVYHFTDRSNLPTILSTGGLYSLREIESRGIKVTTYSSNALSRNLDHRRGFDDYVSLCFYPDNPMAHIAYREGRIKDPIYLRIDISILKRPGVRVYNNFAVRSDATRISPFRALSMLAPYALDSTAPPTYTQGDRYDMTRRYEILVPSSIELDLIHLPS